QEEGGSGPPPARTEPNRMSNSSIGGGGGGGGSGGGGSGGGGGGGGLMGEMSAILARRRKAADTAEKPPVKTQDNDDSEPQGQSDTIRRPWEKASMTRNNSIPKSMDTTPSLSQAPRYTCCSPPAFPELHRCSLHTWVADCAVESTIKWN
ncbi:hypothetical protein XENORESO_012790, partial [Xenotaenia resolanae]